MHRVFCRGNVLFHTFCSSRIKKILKMSASPITHTVLCRGSPFISFVNYRVAACGVAIFKIFLIRVGKNQREYSLYLASKALSWSSVCRLKR